MGVHVDPERDPRHNDDEDCGYVGQQQVAAVAAFQFKGRLQMRECSWNRIGPVSGPRYMARLRATGADLGTGHKNNIRWMTVVTSD